MPCVLGVLALVAALVLGRSPGVTIGVALLGGAYGGSLFLGPRGLDVWAPLEATALVLAAELAHWSLELRPWVAAEPGVLARRAATVAATAAGTLAVSAAVLAAASAPVRGGVGWEAVGVTAAASALAVVVRLARRPV
ncbi:MAG TPA: hypothetical protein VF101_01590 [Gaiellaceae bacterium]